jgi:hypothetical protein
VIDDVLNDLNALYPDDPNCRPAAFPIPDFLTNSGNPDLVDQTDALRELADTLVSVNSLIANPYSDGGDRGLNRSTTWAPRSPADFTRNCVPTGVGTSLCTYEWTENDGQLRVRLVDSHMPTLWQRSLHYDGVASNGESFGDDLVMLEISSWEYLFITIDTSYQCSHYIDNPRGCPGEPVCGFMEWSQILSEYDSIENVYSNMATIKDCGIIECTPHVVTRVKSERSEDQDGDLVKVHWETFLWDMNKDQEFRWIEFYMDDKTQEWSYTVYNEAGQVVAEDSYPSGG